MTALAFLEVRILVFFGSKKGGKKSEEGQSDFDHGEKHCFFGIRQLPYFVVCNDDAKDVSERFRLVEIAAGTEDDKLDDAMGVYHAAEVDKSTNEQLLALVVGNEEIGEADIVVHNLFGNGG